MCSMLTFRALHVYLLTTSLGTSENFNLFQSTSLEGLPSYWNFKFFTTSNKIYREKSIPMTALWCPAFSNHG